VSSGWNFFAFLISLICTTRSVYFILVDFISLIMSGRSQRKRGLRSLEHWDRGFESHSRHGCLCLFILFVLFCVQVAAALRRADPPYKESYRLCIGLRNWKSGQGPTKGL
jgi:hypothetical protein